MMHKALKKLLDRLSSPLPLREGLGVVFLLIMGSTSLQAQDDDPFEDVNPHAFQGYMEIVAQVQQNGKAVTDALVAVYCEDELRGKEKVGSGTHPTIAFLSVYGNNTGYNQYLYFKVYTGGRIYTFHPSPAITWKYDGVLGTHTDPYIITLPISLEDNADNTETLTSCNGATCDVVLTGRTLYKDGKWNTLCLPFSLTAEEVTAYLTPDALMTMGSSDFNSSTGTLTLNFVNATTITAGQPYIIKWNKQDDYEGNESSYDLNEPTFTSVTIPAAYTDADAVNEALDAASIQTEYVNFVGTYSPVGIYTADHTLLYLGNANTIYYPTDEGYKVNACRAYFQLTNGITPGDLLSPAPSNSVQTFRLNFGEEESTGITSLYLKEYTDKGGSWYSLDGRKLSSQPTQNGIYIYNGRKLAVKDSQTKWND